MNSCWRLRRVCGWARARSRCRLIRSPLSLGRLIVMPTQDDDLEEEGQPQLYDPPPGQDIETDQEAPMVPKDRPLGANEWGTTVAEERTAEPLYRRVRREVPDVDERPLVTDEPAPRLMDPDSDIVEIDETPEMVGLMDEDDSAGLTAEEAAVHIVDEP